MGAQDVGLALAAFAVLLIRVDAQNECYSALEKYPKPDAGYTAKHLWSPCPELCVNSSGHFATGQFPHPWDCNAFINCYQDDAWVHWCQPGLYFNENNMQCDWPRNVKCVIRPRPVRPTTTTAVPPTTSSPVVPSKNDTYVTCKDPNTKLNEKEYLGCRPDLCKDGSGLYRTPDCRFYVRCVGTKAYVARCPAGFLFDPVKKQCDWPASNQECLKSCSTNYEGGQSDCGDKVTTAAPPTTTTPRLIATTIPPEDLEKENKTCNDSHCIPKAGCQPELCKQKFGFFAYPKDCTKFANCWDNCAYINNCDRPMVFSEAKGMCDLPWNLLKDHPCYRPEDPKEFYGQKPSY